MSSTNSRMFVRKQRPAVVRRLLQTLEQVAPLRLAGSWDNVGLLLDAPNDPAVLSEKGEFKVFVTNDLTEKVANEAVNANANFIVSYHPTPFRAMRRVDRADPPSRVIMTCLANGISVYSPHTALDCVKDGVNDWLLEAFGTNSGAVYPINPTQCTDTGRDPEKEGEGRKMSLNSPLLLQQVIDRLKKHLKLSHVRVAPAMHLLVAEKATEESVTQVAKAHQVHNIAVCAGSGGSILTNAPEVDVWITGEMSHHEVLAATAEGVSVILTDHSNTEREYLPRLCQRVQTALNDVHESTGDVESDNTEDLPVSFQVTKLDADPLVIV